MTDLSGLTLGRYKLIKALGYGRLTQAYQAVRLTDVRPVVVKVFHPHLTQSEAFLMRLGQEVRRLIRLRHPHIQPILDFGMVDHFWFVVVDYVPGRSLSDYLAEKGALPPVEVLKLAAQLAEALAYAHRQGVMHQAITLNNVLFKDQSEENVVLSDFGLHALLEDVEKPQQSIKVLTGAVYSGHNSDNLMSQADLNSVELRRIDSRLDLDSLGLLLYEMLTGHPTTLEKDFTVVSTRQTEWQVVLDNFSSSLSTKLVPLFRKLLSKDPSAGFQSADALLMTIQAVQRTLPPEAEQPLVRSKLPVKRYRVAQTQAVRHNLTSPTVSSTVTHILAGETITRASSKTSIFHPVFMFGLLSLLLLLANALGWFA
jgi:serine/threonine-protein kinase